MVRMGHCLCRAAQQTKEASAHLALVVLARLLAHGTPAARTSHVLLQIGISGGCKTTVEVRAMYVRGSAIA
jgi:hypothetical protein